MILKTLPELVLVLDVMGSIGVGLLEVGEQLQLVLILIATPQNNIITADKQKEAPLKLVLHSPKGSISDPSIAKLMILKIIANQ